jgi:putative transposase
VKYIAEHRELYGVEPICKELQVAPSTVYAAAERLPSARQLHDADLKVEMVRVHKENFNVDGAWKLWRQLKREGIPVGRDHVARLMPELGLVGTVRGKVWPTTFPRTSDNGQPTWSTVNSWPSGRTVSGLLI